MYLGGLVCPGPVARKLMLNVSGSIPRCSTGMNELLKSLKKCYSSSSVILNFFFRYFLARNRMAYLYAFYLSSCPNGFDFSFEGGSMG